MIKNYFKIAWRNLIKNKAHSSINIVGLSVGMAVAMIIGLWIWDELSYDKDNPNYEKITQVMQNNTINGEIGSSRIALGEELSRNPTPISLALGKINHRLFGAPKVEGRDPASDGLANRLHVGVCILIGKLEEQTEIFGIPLMLCGGQHQKVIRGISQ